MSDRGSDTAGGTSRSQEDVDEKLGALLTDTVELSHRNWRLLLPIVISIVFDVTLSLLLGVALLRTSNTQSRFAILAKTTCERFNTTRAGELALWEPILSAPRAPLPANATDQEKQAYDDATKARAEFEANLHRYFDPIPC